MLVVEQSVTVAWTTCPGKRHRWASLPCGVAVEVGRSFQNRREPPVMLTLLGPFAISTVGCVPKSCSAHVIEMRKGEIGILTAGVLVGSVVFGWAGRAGTGRWAQ